MLFAPNLALLIVPFTPNRAVRPKANTNKPFYLEEAIVPMYFYSVKTTSKNNKSPKMKKLMTTTTNFLANQLHIFVILAASLLTQSANAQDSTYSNYLAKNNEKITIGGSNSYAIFDEAFYNNQLFLVTESHGYYKPNQLDAELFKQINKKNGVRYYLAEVDFSQAYYINKYLNTGNEEFLKVIYEHWYNEQAQWGSKTGFEKWKSLYNYNLSLAKGKKIIVLGLDEAQDLNMNEKLLYEMAKDAKYKAGNKMIDSLLSFNSINLDNDTTKSFIKFTRRFSNDITANENSYKKIFKSNYFAFQFIVKNIASKKGRENKIFENFNTFYNEYKLADKKMYGFWGRFHGMQDSINGGLSFSAMLKKSNFPLATKIISIPVFCVESVSMLPTQFLPEMARDKGTVFSKAAMVNDDSMIYTVDGIKMTRNFVGKNENVIFKLNGASSLFTKGLYLVESNSKFDKTFNWQGNKNAATTDYFQYAIVVSNSDWAVPYGDNKAK